MLTPHVAGTRSMTLRPVLGSVITHKHEGLRVAAIHEPQNTCHNVLAALAATDPYRAQGVDLLSWLRTYSNEN